MEAGERSRSHTTMYLLYLHHRVGNIQVDNRFHCERVEQKTHMANFVLGWSTRGWREVTCRSRGLTASHTNSEHFHLS